MSSGNGEPLPEDVREGLREHRAVLIALHTRPPASVRVTLWVLNAARDNGPAVYLPPAVAAYGAARGIPHGEDENASSYVARLRAAILPSGAATNT